VFRVHLLKPIYFIVRPIKHKNDTYVQTNGWFNIDILQLEKLVPL